MNTITPAERLDARASIFQSMLDSELDRIIAKLKHIPDSEFSNKSVAALYSEEIAAATKRVKMWKGKSPKGSRPVAYEVQKALKKRLELLLSGLDVQADSLPVNALLESSEPTFSATVDIKTKIRPKKPCLNTAKGLNTQGVKEVFEGVKKLVSDEKERAAALTALMVNGYLTGGCANVIEWFKAEIGGKVSTRTLSNSRREYRDEGQFLSIDEQRIFDAVEILAKTAVAKR